MPFRNDSKVYESSNNPTLSAWKTYTRIFCTVVIVTSAIFDIIAISLAGPEATISRLVYYTSRDYPILPCAIGVLLGHFYWPQTPPNLAVRDNMIRQARLLHTEAHTSFILSTVAAVVATLAIIYSIVVKAFSP